MDCETSKQVTSLLLNKGKKIVLDFFHPNHDLWLMMKFILIFVNNYIALDQTKGIGQKKEKYLRLLPIGVGPHPLFMDIFLPYFFLLQKHT